MQNRREAAEAVMDRGGAGSTPREEAIYRYGYYWGALDCASAAELGVQPERLHQWLRAIDHWTRTRLDEPVDVPRPDVHLGTAPIVSDRPEG